MKRLTGFILLMGVMGSALLEAVAQTSPEATPHRITVATKEAPPFAMKNSEGEWEGISIDIWRELARRLSLDFEFRELELTDLLDQVESGEVDAGVSAITVNPEREKRMDFTHSYFSSGLGVGFKGGATETWKALAGSILSPQFFGAVGGLILVLLVAALAVMIFEKRANPEQFGGTLLQSLGSSFWWSAVTMTTVGYGDKSPTTLGGRVVAMIWMFTSIIIISGVTAAIASAITVGKLSSNQLESGALNQLRVAVLQDSSGHDFARRQRLRTFVQPDLESAIESVVSGQNDVIIHDIPLLQYVSQSQFDGELWLRSEPLIEEDYAVVLPPGSPLRETLNIALLDLMGEPVFKDIQYKYLGR